MAKRQAKHIVIPVSLWESTDLTIQEKHLLIDIDSICDSADGVAAGIQTLATLSGLTQKEVKHTLNELYLKGAIDISVDADGAKRIKPYLYKEQYVKRGEKIVIGDKPTDMETIDYDLIQETWNTVCASLPKIERFTPRRKQKVRSCLKGASATVSDLIKVIKLVATSSFLNGSKTSWQCSFDWVIKSPDNFTKIIEGQYHKDFSEQQYYNAIIRDKAIELDKKEDDYYR